MRGLPDSLQYYMGGGLPNLLQYYIGGVLKVYYNITVLKGKVTISYLLMWIYDCKCRKYTFLGGSFQIVTILHSGGCQNLLQYYSFERKSHHFILVNVDI